ncbi:MAG: hypothetical protein ACLUUO_09565 [Sellimonas intestinalis]
MYGTLKKIFAFAGSKKGLLKKSLLFAFLSGLFSALQFAALFVVIGALVSNNRDGQFIWISLGIMGVSPCWAYHYDLFLHDEADRNRLLYGGRKCPSI